MDPRRPDDPRLGEVIQLWHGESAALCPGRAVLVGFPQDEGVRRNHGRPGSAAAPAEIRRHLFRLTPVDRAGGADLAACSPLDAGNVRIDGPLEESQAALAEVVGGILECGAVPIVLGGGHEAAFGHFLGYVRARRRVGIINLDAHLDVRPCLDGASHSGSPFRQAMEHPTQPLAGTHYVCLGAQPHSVSSVHLDYLRGQGGTAFWCDQVRGSLGPAFSSQCGRLEADGCHVYVTIDADVVQAADVPGVSAPNVLGLSGAEVIACVRQAGESPAAASLDLVEINPQLDRDGQSARWGALVIWNFLTGLARRGKKAR
jgi:formiminoglutamase